MLLTVCVRVVFYSFTSRSYAGARIILSLLILPCRCIVAPGFIPANVFLPVNSTVNTFFPSFTEA